jgi:hypothetical protein
MVSGRVLHVQKSSFQGTSQGPYRSCLPQYTQIHAHHEKAKEAARDTASTAEMHFLKEQWPWAAAGGSEGASKAIIDLRSPRIMRRDVRSHAVPPLVLLVWFDCVVHELLAKRPEQFVRERSLLQDHHEDAQPRWRARARRFRQRSKSVQTRAKEAALPMRNGRATDGFSVLLPPRPLWRGLKQYFLGGSGRGLNSPGAEGRSSITHTGALCNFFSLYFFAVESLWVLRRRRPACPVAPPAAGAVLAWILGVLWGRP